MRASLRCARPGMAWPTKGIVRTSHYPQSRHFLDACDEMGLLVLEEISGWHHIGNESWKLISIDNVARMIRRDWNHPSIIFFLILPGSLARKLEGIAWWRSQSP